MFHSAGTSQSNTLVPLATSLTASGISRATSAKVRRTPWPVMLRQIGNTSRAKAWLRSPIASAAASGAATADSDRCMPANRAVPQRQTWDEAGAAG